MRISSAFPIVSTLTLVTILGCDSLSPGPISIMAERPDYNNHIQQTSKNQTFENIVRVYEFDVPQFLDVTQVTAQMNMSGTLTGSASLPQMVAGGGSVASTVGGTSSGQVVNTKTLTFFPGHDFTVGGTLVLSETPTITYQPLQGQALIQQIVTPLTVDNLVSLADSDWKPGGILTFAADRLAPNEADRAIALNAIIDLSGFNAISLGGETLAKPAQTGSSGGSGSGSTPKSDALVLYLQPSADSDPVFGGYIRQLWRSLQWVYGQYVTRIELQGVNSKFVFQIPGTARKTSPIGVSDSEDNVKSQLEKLLDIGDDKIQVTKPQSTNTKAAWEMRWAPGFFQGLQLIRTKGSKPTIKIVLDSSNKIELPMMTNGTGAKPGAEQPAENSSQASGSKLVKKLIIGFGFVEKNETTTPQPVPKATIPMFRTRSALGILKSFREEKGANLFPLVVISVEQYKRIIKPQADLASKWFVEHNYNYVPEYYYFDLAALDAGKGLPAGAALDAGRDFPTGPIEETVVGLQMSQKKEATGLEILTDAADEIASSLPFTNAGMTDAALNNYRLAQFKAAQRRHYVIVIKTEVPKFSKFSFVHQDPNGDEPYVYFDYEGAEYQIAKNDPISRRNFNLLSQFLTMQAVAPTQNAGPTQTLSVGGGGR